MSDRYVYQVYEWDAYQSSMGGWDLANTFDTREKAEQCVQDALDRYNAPQNVELRGRELTRSEQFQIRECKVL